MNEHAAVRGLIAFAIALPIAVTLTLAVGRWLHAILVSAIREAFRNLDGTVRDLTINVSGPALRVNGAPTDQPAATP